jgi:hypothetical protein
MPTGKRLLPKLLEACPSNLRKGDVNEILIRSGEVLGWKEAVQGLLALAHRPVTNVNDQPESFPNLEDDSKWADGQKLDDKQ